MSTKIVKELDTNERVNLANQTQKIAGMPLPQVDVESGNQFVFVAHFDGTNNDKDNLELSGSQYPTNVARLHELMAPHASNNYKVHYEPGVGTNLEDSGFLNASLTPSGDMHAAAERAYNKFSEEALDWLENHPDADPAEALKVIATGFSRGGGTAAVFSQMLYERGLKDPQNGNILVAPGVLGLSGALIFDPVTTNYKGNERFSPTSRNIDVIRAQHEYRKLFNGVDYGSNPHINIVEVMGNHCDIGGGYDRGISALVLENAREMFSRAGLRLSPLNDEMRHREDEPVQIHHEDWGLPSWVTETHDPHDGVETGAPRKLEEPSALAQELTNTHGWRGFNSLDGTIIWHKDYPEASPDTGGIRRGVLVERPGGADELYLTHHDGQVGYYQPQSGSELTRQAVDRLSRQDFPPGKVDITVNMDRPRQIISSPYSRDVAAAQSRGEIADAFAAEPAAALERYPDNKRIHKAANVLDAVNQAHADSPKRQEIEANAKHILADQLRHDRPLLDPRLAGIQSETLRNKIASSPALQNLLKDTEAGHRPYAHDIFNDSYREGMNDETLVGAVMTERKRRFPTLKRNDPKGWNEVQKRLTQSENQTLEQLAKEKGAEATTSSAQKPENTTASSLPDATTAQRRDPKQQQIVIATAFKKDPDEAARTYPELGGAHKALETVRSRAGNRAAAAIHRDLSRRIELGKTIPTPQQAMNMVRNALDRGR